MVITRSSLKILKHGSETKKITLKQKYTFLPGFTFVQLNVLGFFLFILVIVFITAVVLLVKNFLCASSQAKFLRTPYLMSQQKKWKSSYKKCFFYAFKMQNKFGHNNIKYKTSIWKHISCKCPFNCTYIKAYIM